MAAGLLPTSHAVLDPDRREQAATTSVASARAQAFISVQKKDEIQGQKKKKKEKLMQKRPNGDKTLMLVSWFKHGCREELKGQVRSFSSLF